MIRKLLKNGDDDTGGDDSSDDGSSEDMHTVCTKCMEGYVLKNETEKDVVIGGECSKCHFRLLDQAT